ALSYKNLYFFTYDLILNTYYLLLNTYYLLHIFTNSKFINMTTPTPTRKFVLVIFLFLAPVFLIAQALTISNNHKNIDYKKLALIDGVVNDYVAKNQLAGAVTIVIKDNMIVQHKGYGYADLESKKPMPADAMFRIMSQTKAITSVGIMILYEQGKLLLDEPVHHFIPEFKNPVVLDQFNDADTTYTTIPAKREITFRDLLTHTSGLDYSDIGSTKVKAIYAKHGIPS